MWTGKLFCNEKILFDFHFDLSVDVFWHCCQHVLFHLAVLVMDIPDSSMLG